MIDVSPHTVVLFADIGCPWAHRAVYRLHEARSRHGLEDEVDFDIRSFPLEIINEQPTPKKTLDAEISVLRELDADAGWQMWHEDLFTYPVTTLLPMEAVHAAKVQGRGISDRFDRALRLAFFRDSRCVSMQHVVLDIAETIEGLDTDALKKGLSAGTHRRRIFEDMAAAKAGEVKGSPHVFVAGEKFHNPGVEMRWDKGKGVPVIEADDVSVYDRIMKLAAG